MPSWACSVLVRCQKLLLHALQEPPPGSLAGRLGLLNADCALRAQAVLAGVYGAGTSLRLKASGMELAVWVMKHASDERLLPAAPQIMGALLHLLDDGARTLCLR